jgi:hypothetical protein
LPVGVILPGSKRFHHAIVCIDRGLLYLRLCCFHFFILIKTYLREGGLERCGIR